MTCSLNYSGSFFFLLAFENKLLVQDLETEKQYFSNCFPLYHTVPLGSIQELPAESCSEIKASEGNEMVNGDYWIYSEGSGQTILARCEGTIGKPCGPSVKIIKRLMDQPISFWASNLVNL